MAIQVIELSNTLCACNCGQYLAQTLVNNGKVYLWGHKPKTAKELAKVGKAKKEPAIKAVNKTSVVEFIRANIMQLAGQRIALREEFRLIHKKVEDLKTQGAQLAEQGTNEYAALKLLYPGIVNDEELKKVVLMFKQTLWD